MDFNTGDFIDAVVRGQPYRASGVEVRFREPGLTRVQIITLDGCRLGYVSPAVIGEGLTIHWTLNGHDLPRAADVLNALGSGLLGRPLVRLIDGKPHRVRFDAFQLLLRNEEIYAEDWVRASSVHGAEA